ncbi:MAG TPA: alpha/beta hydrolase [Gammaproteobacteria bacterium]|nr:alpha/beta hydrolase [Gammaproteobacteria bacterium]
MEDADLQLLEIEPAGPARSTVIWMHGLGADGHDFEPLIPQLDLVQPRQARFILPHAPRRPVTVNNGYVMRAWYDVRSLDLRQQEDEPGIRASARAVEALIRREGERGVPPGQVVLAGFSQGGAMALHVGLRFAETLAGILVLSAYLPLADTLAREGAPANRRTPLMMAHGTEDPVVPLEAARRSREQLQAQGYPVHWRTYAMGHALCPAEIADLRAWLAGVLP